MSTELQNTLTKIARLAINGITRAQIAEILQAEIEDLEKIMERPEYQAVYRALLDKRLDEQNNIDDLIRSTYYKALKDVEASLDAMTDPDYALRAVQVMSRADRERAANNRPIEQDRAGGVVVIQLGTHFANQLVENAGERAPRVVERHGSRHTDVCQPTHVQKMFNKKSTRRDRDIIDPELVEEAVGAFG